MGGAKVTSPSFLEAANYFRRRLFLFAPNVCNARCDFCYVAPFFAQRAHLPVPTLVRIRKMLRTLTDIGFREIRITGGEPLLLDNLDAVVEALTLRGLSYTILTNGQQLSHWHDLFVDTPPSKVTISIHSSVSPERVFGVDWDVTEILDEVSRLSNKIEFVASVVVVPSVIGGLTNTIDSLIDAGVGELKLIRPNVATDEGEEVFLSVVEIAQRHARAR
ncbi:MAG: radical SAM protein, partial [Nitrosospira sp.]